MSAKRILLTSVLCLGLFLGFFQGVSAQAENVCRIRAYGGDGQTFSNSDCSSYLITYGWLTVAPGLVKEYVNAVSVYASIAGENVNFDISPQEAANLWNPIHSVESASFGFNCPTGLLYQSQLIWNIGQLAPGDYTLFISSDLSHPMTDGIQSCTDDQGQPWPKFMYSGHAENFITVTITP